MSSSVKIVLKNVSKSFGKVKALDSINLEFAPGSLTTLLGPSGCGKTTLLRVISGLEHVTSGEIWFGEETVTHLSASRRDVGMVFQSYALFPHMTVEQNVGYGLGVLKTPSDETQRRVKEALQMVDMDGFQKRYPDELSGGQQQRVAVARAMVLRPEVLLFDEPLSNIDSKLRRSMREDIRRLQQASGITSIYVTHDQSEALAVSDEIIIIKNGIIEQQGPPRSLYHGPESAFVANFIGESNVVDAQLRSDEGKTQVIVGEAVIDLPKDKKTPKDEGPVKLSLRPEIMKLASTDAASHQTLNGIIIQNAYMGPVIEYSIQTEAGIIFTREPAYKGVFNKDEAVCIHIRPDEIILIPENDNED